MAALPRGYVYELSPIDYWTGWTALTPGDEEGAGRIADGETRKELERIRDHGMRQFRDRSDWEGDVRQGPFFAGLPKSDNSVDVMMAVKQDNNGTVYLWSPLELPWLREYLIA